MNLKREAKRIIESLTAWIYKAFSLFVPWRHQAVLGTAPKVRKGPQFRLEEILPPLIFFPTSEIFFSFPARPTTCDLRSTPSSHPLLFPPPSLSPRGHSLSRQGHPLSPEGQSLSRPDDSLSPQALLLSPGGESLSPPVWRNRDRSSVVELNFK